MSWDRIVLQYEIERLGLEGDIVRSFAKELADKDKVFCSDYVNEASEYLMRAMICLKMAVRHIDSVPFEQIRMDI